MLKHNLLQKMCETQVTFNFVALSSLLVLVCLASWSYSM